MAMYQKPPAFMSKVANPMLALSVEKLGFRPWGLAVLHVRGRKTGRINKVPVNPVQVDDAYYLVSPRGSSQWARNLRVAGGADLSLGRDRKHFTATEIGDDEKLPILREYVRRFGAGVGKFMGVDKDSTDAQVQAIAENHPVFRIQFDS